MATDWDEVIGDLECDLINMYRERKELDRKIKDHHIALGDIKARKEFDEKNEQAN